MSIDIDVTMQVSLTFTIRDRKLAADLDGQLFRAQAQVPREDEGDQFIDVILIPIDDPDDPQSRRIAEVDG